jgi:hypothetical protein
MTSPDTAHCPSCRRVELLDELAAHDGVVDQVAELLEVMGLHVGAQLLADRAAIRRYLELHRDDDRVMVDTSVQLDLVTVAAPGSLGLTR